MFYQTDHRLNALLCDDECYLFSILDIFENVGQTEISVIQYEEIHKVCTRLKYIGYEGYELSGYINKNGVSGIASVASSVNGTKVYMRLVTKDALYTHRIGKWVRTKSNGKLSTHFVVMHRDIEAVTFDPWDKNGSRTVRDGRLDGYRYIFAEAI